MVEAMFRHVTAVCAVAVALLGAAAVLPAAGAAVPPDRGGAGAPASRDDTPPPNERLPKVPTPPDLGDAPWTTPAGKDMKGYRLSTYTGKYYDKAREQYRICVIQRESGGNYEESSGPWRGAYQFSDSLAAGALRTMRDEMVKSYGDAGRRVIDSLEGTLIYTWPRFFQDMAFWTTFNKGAGASHWAGGGWYCNPARNAESGWPNPGRWNYTPLERSASRSVTAASFGTPEYSLRVARDFIRGKYDWGYAEFKALKAMWWRESNWRYSVINPHPNGPWYGLGQVNGGFINDQGYSIKDYMNSPEIQVKVGAAYIKARYGSPTKAWSFWQANGWY